MIAESKLTFAAWTGFGITALFGGTGIYLVGNSQNSGKGKGKEEKEEVLNSLVGEEQTQKVSNPVSSLEESTLPTTPLEVIDPEEQDSLPKKQDLEQATEDNQNPKSPSEVENPSLKENQEDLDPPQITAKEEMEEEIRSFSLDDGEDDDLVEITER